MSDKSPYIVVAGLVSFEVLANDAPLDSTCRVLSASVTKGINKIGSARFELIDGDPASGTFPVADAQTFVPGTPITIRAGYDNEKTTIFKGIVIKLSVVSQGAQGLGVTVECRDIAIQTNGAPRNCLFKNQTTSAALQQLIGTYAARGITAALAATTEPYEELAQSKTTDWDFIVAQAEANGQIVVNDLGKITTLVPSTDTEPVLTLEYGTNVYSFSLDMDARTQYQSVKGRAWSPKQQQTIEVTAALPAVQTMGNVEVDALAAASGQREYVLETAATDQGTLQALADAYQMKLALAKVTGRIEMPGSSAVLPGSIVRLSRVGNRFSGKAFVAEVTHTLGADWKTQLGIGLAEQWFAPRTPDVGSPVKAAVTTAAGLVLEFDDGQQLLTIKTPGDAEGKKPHQLAISGTGQRITLTDQHQHSVTLSADGLTLNSQSSLKITTANDLTLESSGGNVTITAAKALTLSGGTTASVAGEESLSLTATGPGKLSVDGPLAIKGLEVAIN